jgi:hypothetical protein
MGESAYSAAGNRLSRQLAVSSYREIKAKKLRLLAPAF